MWLEIFRFAIFGVILYGLSLLITRIMQNLKKKDRIAPYLANSIQLIVRISIIGILFIAFFSFVPLELNQILSISSITGLIVGFASTEVLIQVLSGIYIFTARPFKVNELVQIDTITGIVLDIGINFTVLQQFDGSRVKIPNKKVLDSRIRNYTKQLSTDLLKKQYHQNSYQKKRAILLNWVEDDKDETWLDNVSEIFLDLDVTRYTFDIELDLGLNPIDVFTKLNTICENYTRIFDFSPKFMIINLGWRVTIRFRIYCTQPSVIMKNYSLFLADVVDTIYGALEGGTAK